MDYLLLFFFAKRAALAELIAWLLTRSYLLINMSTDWRWVCSGCGLLGVSFTEGAVAAEHADGYRGLKAAVGSATS